MPHTAFANFLWVVGRCFCRSNPQRKLSDASRVTGHVLCIDPLGVAVEPPPPEAALPCKKPEEVRGQWSYSPNCTSEIEGM